MGLREGMTEAVGVGVGEAEVEEGLERALSWAAIAAMYLFISFSFVLALLNLLPCALCAEL